MKANITSRGKLRDRWQWERKLWKFNIDITTFINNQCLGLGLTINWNWRPSIEVDLLQWRIYIEFQK